MVRIIVTSLLALFFAAAPVQADEHYVCTPLIGLVDGLIDAQDEIGMSQETLEHLQQHLDDAKESLAAGDDDQCVQSIDEALAIRDFDV